MAVKIRPYSPHDFEDVLFLNQICYLKPCGADELREKLQNAAWVAEDDGVIGCLISCSDADKIWTWSITVSPAYRRQGIAFNLMSECENHYAGLAIYLHVDSKNPAISLYQRRGYRILKTLKDYYGAGYDALLMENPNGR